VLSKDEEQRFLECDRHLMLLHFRAANERIAQLEVERIQASASNAELKKKLDSEMANQEDIFEYLRGEIHNKNNLINELQDKNLSLMEDQERLTQEHERSQQELADRSMEEKAILQQDVASVRAELKKVELFIKREAELEEELAEKKRLLEEGRQEHATSVSDLERKHVQEKDRLKKEMLFKLRETKANLLKMTDNQLDTTTKRTIAENEQMSSELAWQSKETEKLIRKNDRLMSENASLKRELSLHKQTQEEFARKVNVYQKTIKTLLAKLNDLDAKQQVEMQRMHLEDDEKEREKAEGLRERDGLEEGLAETVARLQAASEEVARVTHALQAVEGKYANVLALQDEAVKFTLQCLLDMQLAQPPSLEQQPANGRHGLTGDEEGDLLAEPREASELVSLQALDLEKREEVMQYILDQLRAYQEQLKELELHHAWKRHTTGAQDGVSLPPIPHGAGASSPVWAAPLPPHSFAGGDARVRSTAGDSPDETGAAIGIHAPLRESRLYGKRGARLPRA